MKNCPATVDGSLGPWYQRVNRAVREAQACEFASELREILGEPDKIDEVEDDDRRVAPDAPIDSRYPEEIWVYFDPYRPRKEYHFGVTDGRVVSVGGVRHVG